MSLINLYQAAIYTKKDLPHQQKAWDYLTANLTEEQMLKFADLYRTAPEAPKVQPATQKQPSKAHKYPLQLLSQRDNRGSGFDSNDWAQTCLPTSVTMVIRAYTGKLVSVKEIDYALRVRYGNRYSHDNAVRVMSDYGLRSKFSTSTPIDKVKAHLASGNLVVLSWLVTHSGHISVIADYKDGKFLIYDPYGEPFINPNGSMTYKDIRKPYWISETAVRRLSANTQALWWAHLVSYK
jgi:hypothetical protein